MYTPETWRASGVARSPSHESVTTDLSLFSVSSAASDARVLRLLACRAGQGPDPTLRVASPNPESIMLNTTSEMGLCAAIEVLTLNTASRSCSTWVAVGGSQLPSPQRSHMYHSTQRQLHSDNRRVRQTYIKKRLVTTYRALERMSQSDFNLDRLEAAAVNAVANTASASGPGPTSLAVPPRYRHSRFMNPEAAQLALTSADLERERGRPLSKYERNMMIFNWLHTLDEAAPF